jgi:hypothetical protein
MKADKQTYCRITLRRDSVRRDEEPFSDKYCGKHLVSQQPQHAERKQTYFVRFVKH